MSPDPARFLLACGAACVVHTVICISFLSASQLSFSLPRILAAHALSLLAGALVLASAPSPAPAGFVAFILITLPALVGCYGLALHAHNSIAFRLLHEISASNGLSSDELQAVHSSQELRVKRRLDELVRHRYVVLEKDLVFPTPRGMWVFQQVQFLRGLFGSLVAPSPTP
jgi:hypothetical protein